MIMFDSSTSFQEREGCGGGSHVSEIGEKGTGVVLLSNPLANLGNNYNTYKIVNDGKSAPFWSAVIF